MESVNEVPESYFKWTVNDEAAKSKNTGRYAYTGFSSFVILGESTVGGQVILSLDNSNGHPVTGPKSFNLEEQSTNEIIYENSNGKRWSTKNSGGSGIISISLYQTFDDATFTKAFVEGTFSGVLTSEESEDIFRIEDGEFGVSER